MLRWLAIERNIDSWRAMPQLNGHRFFGHQDNRAIRDGMRADGGEDERG